MTKTLSTLNVAFKEWAVAVDALAQGKTIVLLRKGGIREPDKSFQVKHSPVLLYPTYEHQQPHLLKRQYATKVIPVESGWHPENIELSCWAEITQVFQVRDESVVSRLFDFHIWNSQFISDRLKWKPNQPLNLLLLRVYKLAESVTIPYTAEYGGCKSWLELNQPISLEKSIPVFSDADYAKQVNEIAQLL